MNQIKREKNLHSMDAFMKMDGVFSGYNFVKRTLRFTFTFRLVGRGHGYLKKSYLQIYFQKQQN